MTRDHFLEKNQSSGSASNGEASPLASSNAKGVTRAASAKVGSATATGRIPWLAITALAMGMLVYGVAESYGPVATISSLVPQQYYYVGLSLSFIAGGFGALLAGFLTDKMGRRNSFLFVAAMILVGVVIFLAAPTNIYALVISFILVGMAAIGLETPILTAIAEVVPAKWRGNLEVIVQNFGNLGVAIVFIPVLLGFSAAQEETAYALLFIAPLVAMVLGYWAVKESVPWSAVTGKSNVNVDQAWQMVDQQATEKVSPKASLTFRLLMITVIGIAQDVAFTWITYDMGFLYFTDYSSLIPLIGGLTMVVVGVLFGVFFAHKVSRRSAALIAYGSLVALWGLLWGYVALTGSFAGLALLAIVTLLFLPTELTWGVRAMLEPELFPTGKRGTFVSVARAIVWIVAGVVTLILSMFYYPSTPAQAMGLFNVSSAVVMAVFLLGLILSVAWYFKGFETGAKSLSGYDIKKA
ncbi:MAG: MFS transporter [Thermoprotei archaeon]